MADSLDELMKAIQRFEKREGGNHRYRHISGALREARYAASRVSANENWESPGRQQARETATKAHVPEAADERNPTVPEDSSSAEGGTNVDGAASTA